jgi:hypothetical protein
VGIHYATDMGSHDHLIIIGCEQEG